MPAKTLTFRSSVLPSDAEAVRDIVSSSGFFYDHEIPVAVELVEERLSRGASSDYLFCFIEVAGKAVAYTCFGKVACTASSWDLYWIAVHDSKRGQGIGGELLRETERLIRDQGGTRIYIETSGRPLYTPTRHFYEREGYFVEAVLKDFYAENDDKLIFRKEITPEPKRG